MLFREPISVGTERVGLCLSLTVSFFETRQESVLVECGRQLFGDDIDEGTQARVTALSREEHRVHIERGEWFRAQADQFATAARRLPQKTG
jgi:hypothetical protein